MKFLVLAFLFSSTFVHARVELEKAADFFEWLEIHTKDFATCEPVKQGDDFILCDQTKVSSKELKKLFSLSADALITEIKDKGLTVEIVCDPSSKLKLASSCVPESTDQSFKEISSLHGKYIPESKKILIRNSASPGSLIHEYIHYLQSSNENKVYGKVYKKERNQVQNDLVSLMDQQIAKVQKLEKARKKTEVETETQVFMIASDAMRGFAPWQDLIDERNIFYCT